jgi:hypothetical protein
MRILMISVLALAASMAAPLAQDVGAQAASYCPDLKQIAALAMTKERFASITGKPRDGNFLDTSLPLRGWKDCSLYGPGAPDRSSSSYVVLHAAEGPVSITLSTDETDNKEYVVRLILFVRRN